ncbi:MAG: hypothetical protein HYR60_02825 [Acidobacteria bacterium]|nr:hypothetical protein [Acidobacteriota bacterium]
MLRNVWIAISMGAAIAAAQPAPARFSQQEMEKFLLEAKILEKKELSTGVTNSQRAVLDNGEFKHDAHIQTVSIAKSEFEGTRGKEINFKDSYKFNMAAYELDKILGLHMVPPSVERKVAGQSAALTWWVDDTWMTELQRVKGKTEPPDQANWNKQMYIVRVFDQLIYNTDRNLGNLVIDKSWKIWMIDHTRAFRMQEGLQNKANLVQCDRKLLAALRGLNRDELTGKLKPYLTAMEIKGLFARRDAIVKFFDEAVRQKGEAAVLYDLL